MSLTVLRVGAEAADDVFAVIAESFGHRPVLDPPADALAETRDSVAAALAAHGGYLALLDGRPVGATLLEPEGETLWLRRFGVLPADQRHGLAHAIVDAVILGLDRSTRLRVLAREELPGTITFWQHQGFGEVARHSPYVELARHVDVTRTPTGEDTQESGRQLSSRLRPGDLVVLTGELGAGKTTFTQGLGDGLGVRGPITSPTFVIARVHPSLVGGPALVHVDAYRLGGHAELDDLDLDASLDESVTVVEWGEGLAEQLADSRLVVRLVRDESGADETRRILISGIGPRWAAENAMG